MQTAASSMVYFIDTGERLVVDCIGGAQLIASIVRIMHSQKLMLIVLKLGSIPCIMEQCLTIAFKSSLEDNHAKS